MDKDGFWKLIETTRRRSDGCEELAERLFDSLQELMPADIRGFHQQMRERLDESYRHDLWAVAYIVNGGCSDDGFEYFRAWLIAQGRDYFEAALRDPESAAILAKPNANECEDILYVAARAYEAVAGEHLPVDHSTARREPLGTRWEESDLARLYPRLAERFLA